MGRKRQGKNKTYFFNQPPLFISLSVKKKKKQKKTKTFTQKQRN
jgi:hypothetical protein